MQVCRVDTKGKSLFQGRKRDWNRDWPFQDLGL